MQVFGKSWINTDFLLESSSNWQEVDLHRKAVRGKYIIC